jgi:hypothetical protein
MKRAVRLFYLVITLAVMALIGISPQPALAIIALDPAPGTPACVVGIYGAENPAWIAEVQSKLNGTGLFSQIDIHNANTYTPTLAELQGYDAVLVYSEMAFANNVAMGDVLADYMDAGGGVVMSTFSFFSPTDQMFGPLGISGAIFSNGYLPFASPAFYSFGQPLTLIPDLPNDLILAGVNTFSGGSGSYHNLVSLAPGATEVAHWSDGIPLVATMQPTTGKIVGLNFYPGSSDVMPGLWDPTTDGARLMGNALAWAGNCIDTVGSLSFLGASPRYPSSTDYVNLRWGGSTTPGVTYELERSVNGGSYVKIYAGSLATARYKAAILPRGQHVYRARALKNGYQPSAWRTSQPIMVR